MTPQELRDRTKQFGVDIVTFCETLPKDGRTQEIAQQLVDAGTGVGAPQARRWRTDTEMRPKS
jgi:hypothetical protein